MKYKVLQVQGGMNKGGVESVIMGWYRSINREEIQFDFTTMTKNECPYDAEIKSKGGNIIYIPSRSDVGNIKHIMYLYKAIKENGPYIAVHSHMNFHGGIVALAAKLAGVKNIVIHSHNTKDDGVGFKRSIEIAILKVLLLILGDKHIACGLEAGKFLFGKYKKFEVINNSVDLNIFKYKEDDNINNLKEKYKLNNKIILGHIGRFSKQKNHEFIIKIVEELNKTNLDFKFLLIGDGELKDEIFEQIKEKKLENRILYLGLQEDISSWLNIMDILIFPSLYEGLPVVLVEAQATGLPCIISENITNEVDLGVGLITKLSLSNVEPWINNIIYKNNLKIKDNTILKEKINNKGYSLYNNTIRMIDIYKTNRTER